MCPQTPLIAFHISKMELILIKCHLKASSACMTAKFYARKLTKTAIGWIEVESFKGMETQNRNDGNKRKKWNQAFSQCSNHYIDEKTA